MIKANLTPDMKFPVDETEIPINFSPHIVSDHVVLPVSSALMKINEKLHLLRCQQIAHIGSWETEFSEGPFFDTPAYWSNEAFKIFIPVNYMPLKLPLPPLHHLSNSAEPPALERSTGRCKKD